MKKFRTLMAFLVVMTMIVSTLSFACVVSAAATTHEATTIDADDFHYGCTDDGQWYIKGFLPGKVEYTTDTDVYPYDIVIPKTVTLKTVDYSFPAGVAEGAEPAAVSTYIVASAEDIADPDITTQEVTISGIAKAAFSRPWFAADALHYSDAFNISNKRFLTLNSFTYEGGLGEDCNITSIGVIKNDVVSTTKNDDCVISNVRGPMQTFYIPDSVTSTGRLLRAAECINKLYIGKGVKTLVDRTISDPRRLVEIETYANAISGVSALHRACSVQQCLKKLILHTPVDGYTNDGYIYAKSSDNSWTWQDVFANNLNSGENSRLGWALYNGLEFYVDDVAVKEAMIATEYTYPVPVLNEGTGKYETSENYVKVWTEDNVHVLPYVAYGEDMTDESGTTYRLKYEVSDGEATVVGFDTETDGYNYPNNVELTIPATITTETETVPVAAIGDKAFSYASYVDADPSDDVSPQEYLVSRFTISDGVKKIGKYAFEKQNGLYDVDIPKSVTEIGYKAFSSCIFLANVNIENGGTELFIDGEVFNNCQRLKGLVFPEYVSLDKTIFQATNRIKYIVFLGTISDETATNFTPYYQKNIVSEDKKTQVYMNQASYDKFVALGKLNENGNFTFTKDGNPQEVAKAIVLDDEPVLLYDAINYASSVTSDDEVSVISLKPVDSNLVIGMYSDNTLEKVKVVDINLQAGISTFNMSDATEMVDKKGRIITGKQYKAMLWADNSIAPLCEDIEYGR